MRCFSINELSAGHEGGCVRFYREVLERARHRPAALAALGSCSPLVDQRSDQGRPARLVRGAQASAIVAVEILEEQDQVAPVGVHLESLGPAVHGAAASLVAREDPDQAVSQLATDFWE